MPSIAPKSLAAGASTSLYAALDPSLKGRLLFQCPATYHPFFDTLLLQTSQALSSTTVQLCMSSYSPMQRG